jgi:hypothetical protein
MDPLGDPPGTPPASPRPPGSAAPSAPETRGPLALPGTRAVIGTALDLAYRARDGLRSASLAIGFQVLATLGPLVLLLLVLADRAPDLLDAVAAGGAGPTPTEQETTLAFVITLTGLIAIVALTALAIESRIIGAALLGSRAMGQPMRPLEALRRSRQVFWRVLGATLLVQIPLSILSGAVSSAVTGMAGSSEASLAVSTVVTMLASVPFAYVLTGIVLGGAPALMAIRRSFAMARVRWRIAFVVAVAETLAQTLLIFGLLTALDIVARVADILGLGLDTGTVMTYLTLVVAMFVVAAVGSLMFTVSALAVAPQVVAFVGLTGYGGGLDRARDEVATRPVHWLSAPMAIGAGVAIVASVLGVSSILGGS